MTDYTGDILPIGAKVRISDPDTFITGRVCGHAVEHRQVGDHIGWVDGQHVRLQHLVRLDEAMDAAPATGPISVQTLVCHSDSLSLVG